MKTFFTFVCVALIAGLSGPTLVAQSVQIPYQGYIAAKSGKAYNGTYQFEFAIVIGNSTQPVWNSGAVSLLVSDGIYSVILGNSGQPSLNASLFVNNADTRLRISFNDGVKGRETLSPDVQFLPVPYAVRAKYADTSFVQTALPPMDSLVLRDSRGIVRMVMNPNTGTFSMKNNDTTWYSISVNSPPTEKWNDGIQTTEKKTEPNGDVSVTTTDNKTGKLNESTTVKRDPKDGSFTEEHKQYDKSGNLKTEETKTMKPDGTSTEKTTRYREDGKSKEYEYTSETKNGTNKSSWKEYDEKGETQSSGERTSTEGETTESKEYDKDGNLVEEYTEKDGKNTTTYYKNGKPSLKVEQEKTTEGSSTTSTKYDENGEPVSSRTTGLVNGKWVNENKDLKGNKSSSNEPGKSTEKAGNSSTTTEPGKIDIKVGVDGMGLGIDGTSGYGQLWYGPAPSTDNPSFTFTGKDITLKAPKVITKTNENRYEPITTDGNYIFTTFVPNSTPQLGFGYVYGSRMSERQNAFFDWNGQNLFGISVSDSSSGGTTGLLWDPLNRTVNSTHDLTAGRSIKSDTIKPKSKSTVTFSTGITVNGQSNFGNTIDVAGAAQIQQNGTFTGTAAVVQNATVQQQLRTNQILPVSPSTTVTINGNLNVVGNLTKGGGNFKIDHPLDPYNKYLIHSFVESPDRTNIYSGNITTDSHGIGIVQLPSYFEAANNDFRYQLTVIGADARAFVLTEISNNTFTVQTSIPNVKVSWQVTSTRIDNFARSNRYEPEQEKEPTMKGKLLYPIQE
ncbi:MAG: hypothetical protein JST20_01305 [Bacteroidetes bacterium]|nr:hypothetical protein [Bacteroidota bacterium]